MSTFLARIKHRKTGRLDPRSEMVSIEENLTYGKVRGVEQHNIEKYKTRTGKIGEAVSSINQGNKYNFFDHNRIDSKAAVFKDNYNNRIKRDS